MKKHLCLSLIIVSFLLAQKVVVQTDWHGGPGVLGPVDDWGIYFFSSTNINYLYEYGRISLAAEMNTSPTRIQIFDERTGSQVQTGDLDNDGDADVVAILYEGTNSGRISWFENDGNGNFGGENLILSSTWPTLCVADVNNDGYADILTTNDTYIFWHKNDHAGGFVQHEVGRCRDVDAIGVMDFNEDGHLEVIGSAYQCSMFAWFENDGAENFTRHVIEDPYYGEANGPTKTADLDGDGDIDIVIISPVGRYLHWWENDGGSPPSFTQHVIQSPYNTFVRTFDWLIDMDKDGDIDILTTAGGENSVDWWENDGAGNFTRHQITNSYTTARGIVGIDIDYDGDIDIITASEGLRTLDLWENDGNMNFTRRNFATNYTGYALWVDDMDNDGFVDVVSTAWTHPPNTTDWSLDWWTLFDHFVSPGELVSSIIDSKVPYAHWGKMEYDAVLKPGTSIKFQARASDDPSNMGSWEDVPASNVLNLHGRYFQYKVILETTDPGYTPLLYEVRFTYWGCDLAVDSIVFPADTVDAGDEILPEVDIRNTLEVKSDKAYLLFEIDSADVIVYADTVEIPQIDPKQSERIKMRKKWKVGVGDEDFIYKAKAYIECDEDRDEGNNYGYKHIYRPAGAPGIFEVKQNGIRITAVKGGIRLSNGFNHPLNVVIYDISGKRVENIKVNSGEEVYKTLCAGVYFVVIRESYKNIKKKVVIY